MVMTVARARMVRPSRSLMPMTFCRSPVIFFGRADVHDFGLLDEEIGLRLEHFAHFYAVLLLVALRAGRPDGRAARSVEQAELDADGVGDFAHDAAEGVDFAHKMALGDAADGRIAGHLRDEIEVQREEGGAQAHARGGDGGFAAGMSGSDDDDIVLFGEGHCPTPILKEPEQSACEGHGCGENLRQQEVSRSQIASQEIQTGSCLRREEKAMRP